MKRGISYFVLIAFLLLLMLVLASPLFSFVQQTPADISSTNIYSTVLNITYNITDAIGLNASNVNIYFKTNTSDSDCYIYLNGTSTCGYQTASYITNSTDLFSFNLNPRDVYPGIYNYNETDMVNTAHQPYLLNSNSTYLRIRFFNVSNSKQYSIFELFANASTTSAPLRLYYCNSSYSYGDPPESSNCQNFYNLDSNVPFNHSHIQSSHHLIPFAVNTSNGKIGGTNGVYVTPTSYFLLRGREGSDWNAYYISNVSRADTVQNMSSGLTTTLRPDAVGSSTNLVRTCSPTSACTANWQAVDEVTSDGDTTRVMGTSTSVITYDLYNSQDLSITPSLIKKVTVYMVVRATSQCSGFCQARTELRTNGVDYHGTTVNLAGTSYTTRSTEYINNPSTGQPWTVSEINAMQIGVGLRNLQNINNRRARATQVYAVVEYANWANFSGTVDAHLNQYDGSDTFYYYVCGNDTSGTGNCSAVRTDLLDLSGLPPTAPEVYAPVTDYYSGDIIINYSKSNSPNEYPISFYNLSLVFTNTTFIQTIQTNNSVNLSYIWNSSEASDGSYRISVEACDNQNQCSSGRSQIFTIDNTKPTTISFVSPTEVSGSNLSRNYIDVNVTATDTNFERIRISLYNTTELIQVASGFTSPFFWNFTDLPDGGYSFNATTLDLANNSNSTESRSVTIDTTGPVVQFVSPTTSEGENNQTWIYANVSAVDAYIGLKNISVYLYNLTDLVNSTNSTTSPLQINFTGLNYDTYFINSTAYDNLNNSASTETRAIVLSAVADTTPPAFVSNLNSSVVNTTAINWQWTNPVDADFYEAILYLDGENIINTTDNYYNSSGLVCETLYNLTINTKDYSGNINTTDVTNINTTSFCPDTTPPTSISDLSSTVLSTSAINWQWTNPLDPDFNSSILYLNGVNIADTSNNFYNATGLTCGTQYTFTVNTRDGLWNINTSDVTDTATTNICPGAVVSTTSQGRGGGSSIKKFGPTAEELKRGYQQILYRDWKILFMIDNILHTFNVEEVTKNYTKISISSETQTAILTEGEEKRFELSGDNYFDLLVKVNAIKYPQATFTLKSIHEKIGEKEEDIIDNAKGNDDIVKTIDNDEIELKNKSIFVWILAGIIIAFLILVFIFHNRNFKNILFFVKLERIISGRFSVLL